MKKIVLILILLLSLLLVGCTFVDAESETIVETNVGNLTKEEFYEVLKSSQGEQVLKEMITVKVLEDRFDVTKNDIDREVQTLKDLYEDSYENFVQQHYIDEETLRHTLKIYLLQEQAIIENTDISEIELKERYDRKNIEFDVQHIVVPDEETAKDIKSQLDDGGDFTELASKYSIDETANTSGNLGYISAGKMVEEFENAIYSMRENDISEPVQTEFGFHIIKVNDIRENEENTEKFIDVKEEIRRELVSEQVDEQQMQEIIDNLLKESDIKINIEEFSDLFQ